MARSSRVPKWAIAVIALLVVALAGIGAAAVWLVAAGGQGAVAAADVHWDSAMRSMETLESCVTTASVEDLPRRISSLKAMCEEAAAALDEAESAASRIGDPTAQGSYLDAVTDARAALQETELAVVRMEEELLLAKDAALVRDRVREAGELLEAAESSNASERHAEGLEQARAALAKCDEARDALEGMTAIAGRHDDEREIREVESAAVLLDAHREVAEESVVLHESGVKGWRSTHEVSPKRYASKMRAVAVAPEPAFFADPGLFADGALAQVRSAVEKLRDAQAAHEDAVYPYR